MREQWTLTRVDFPVAAHTIGIHNALEAGGEAVGPDERWRHVLAGDAVSNSTHSFLTLGYPGRETEADARACRNPVPSLPGPSEMWTVISGLRVGWDGMGEVGQLHPTQNALEEELLGIGTHPSILEQR